MSPAPITVPAPAADADAPPAGSHQCGRCRQWFPTDAGPGAAAQGDWWTCPPCHDALFSNRSKQSS